MKLLSKKLALGMGGAYVFFCPGCETPIRLKGWEFNGNAEQPTFSPSVLTTAGSHRCHSFIRDGKIQFLDDCTHAFAGKTVDLPDIPDWLIEENNP